MFEVKKKVTYNKKTPLNDALEFESPPAELSEEQDSFAEELIEDLQDYADRLRSFQDSTNNLKQAIIDRVNTDDSALTVDITGNTQWLGAARRLFQVDKKKLTYEDYLLLLETKRILEQEDVKTFMEG